MWPIPRIALILSCQRLQGLRTALPVVWVMGVRQGADQERVPRGQSRRCMTNRSA